tara:strand:+ start:950 stop:1975 length:1026 start_codon:yes stop_codon:yes gene_type:complete
MTNILTITPYKEFSSIGEKSFNFISSLDTIDSAKCFNVFHSLQSNYNKKMDMSFNEKTIDIDICAMYLNAENFVKTKYYSMGVYEPETENNYLKKTYISYLDSLVVYSERQKDICNHLNKNVRVLRPSINLEGLLRPLKSIDRVLKFYVPAIAKTANVDLIVKSYFKSFSSTDNVALGVLSSNPQKDVERFNKIKDECSTGSENSYPEIILFQDVKDMHNQCHCCIDVDSTYKVNLSSLIALKFGNPVICLETSSIQEWLPESSCYKLASYEDFVIDSDRDFICSGESWQMFSLRSLSDLMRSIYDDRPSLRHKQNKIVKEYYNIFDTKNSNSSAKELICF